MSAPAVKTSMPGTTQSSTGHTMMPMNMVAQKVVPSGEAANMKPMTGNYVTLQAPNQPISLIPDHRAPGFPTPFNNSVPPELQKMTEPESNKNVHNGTEQSKDLKKENPTSTGPVASTPIIPAIVIPTPNLHQNAANNMSSFGAAPKLTASQTATSVNTPQKNIGDLMADKKNLTETSVPGKLQDNDAAQKPKEDLPKKNEDTPDGKTNEKKSFESAVKELESRNAPSSQDKITGAIKMEDSKVESPQKTTPTKQSPVKLSPEKAEKTEGKDDKTPSRAARRRVRDFGDSKEVKEAKDFTPDSGSRSRRNRVQTTPYQSPLPEMSQIVKNLSKSKPPTPKQQDDKLIVFYKNEFMAVRNTEGSFYVCQAMQNIYKTSKRIRIRWLCQDKNNGEIYFPDFYDHTEFDCILTNLNLNKVEKNKYQLTKYELLRTENILKRAIDVEAGVSEKPSVTEEHPDGLDLSLYKDEAQLTKRKSKSASKGKRQHRKSQKDSSSEEESSESDDSDDSESSSNDKTNKTTEAKPVTKSPTRSERAQNRNKPVVTNAVSSAASSSASPNNKKKSAPTEAKTNDQTKKAAVSSTPAKPLQPLPAVASTSGNANSPSRAAKRGSNQATPQETKTAATNTSGRPKRQAANATISSTTASTSEDSSPRKKPRGRA